MTRGALIATVLALAVACKLGPKKQVIPVPNTPSPATAGFVEQTKYADKVVTSNWTKDPLSKCVLYVGAHTADLEAIPAGATVTVMRSRFRPYVDADPFLAEKNRRIECDAPSGRVAVTFPDMGTFTAPESALHPKRE